MARPTAPVAGTDKVGGRGFFNAAGASYLGFTGNGTAQSPYFYATQGQTQMTFFVNRPSQPGTWMPNWIDDQGNLVPLLSAARAITANANDGITLPINADLFAITFTNNNNTSGTIQSFYMGEGGSAG